MQRRNRLLASIIGLIIYLLILQTVWAVGINGFDIRDALIPSNQIYQGGPGKDGIPAIDDANFISVKKTDWLQPDDRVLALEIEGVAKVYPVSILNWHEIVNDQISGQDIVVTYCPLCGSGVAFSAQVQGRSLTFGVSGLLYNSDVLIYDRETDSLWSQLMRQAISGPMKGNKLNLLPLVHTTWERWAQQYPNTLVLSTDTGFQRDYQIDPYAGYQNNQGLYFPVSNLDPSYHPKQLTLGVEIHGQYKAYPYTELDRVGKRFSDSLGGQRYEVVYNRNSQTAWIEDKQGNKLPAITTFWFAWMAFHPNSTVFSESKY